MLVIQRTKGAHIRRIVYNTLVPIHIYVNIVKSASLGACAILLGEILYRPMPECSAGEDETMIDTRHLIVHRCSPLGESHLHCGVLSIIIR